MRARDVGRAADLTVNGSQATDCSPGEATYDFVGFDAPSGSVSVALASGSFQDLAGNLFAGADWDYTFTTCHTPPQDADGDSDVDLADFLVLQGCYNGPNRPWNVSGDQAVSACMDDDLDLDVDLAAFGVFQGCFNGPNEPPACGGGDSLPGDAGLIVVAMGGSLRSSTPPLPPLMKGGAGPLGRHGRQSERRLDRHILADPRALRAPDSPDQCNRASDRRTADHRPDR
jgi:hypothetical protein